jgi:hypothetical protein
MWVEHDGKGMPVSPETKVVVKFRDGEELTDEDAYSAAFWDGEGKLDSNWNHQEQSDDDIVAYRVIEDDWVDWDGSSHMPVPGDVTVCVKFRDDMVASGYTAKFWHGNGGQDSNWSDLGRTCDIVAYRVIE